jgi:hypothetical protein
MDVPRVRLFCIGFSGRDRFALTEPVPLTFVDLKPTERTLRHKSRGCGLPQR